MEQCQISLCCSADAKPKMSFRKADKHTPIQQFMFWFLSAQPSNLNTKHLTRFFCSAFQELCSCNTIDKPMRSPVFSHRLWLISSVDVIDSHSPTHLCFFSPPLTSESNHVQIIKSSWVFEAHQQGLNDVHGQNLLEIHHSSGPEMPLNCCWQPHVTERLCGLAPLKLVPVICFDHCVAVVRFGALFHPQTLVVFLHPQSRDPMWRLTLAGLNGWCLGVTGSVAARNPAKQSGTFISF